MPQHKIKSNIFKKLHYLTSGTNNKQLVADNGYEIAFLGRANVGKSTIINALAEQKSLARTSKTPGRTQMINLFALDDHRRIVDLPGYGYSKASKSEKQAWSRMLNEYLCNRHCLRGLILIMDIRHPLLANDQEAIEFLTTLKPNIHILLNKADKLSKSQAAQQLHKTKKQFYELYKIEPSISLISGRTGAGFDELYKVTTSWLHLV